MNDVCEECGYNTPHHSNRCSKSQRTEALCPEHAPADGRPPIGSDDAKLTCQVCRKSGYHVEGFSK